MHRNVSLTSLFLGTVLLVAHAAVAVDGRFEINHACALAGCFSGDTPGYPVTGTNPASYVLTSDLILPAATSGITLQADDVHVDLNGFSIRGPATCAPAACSSIGALVGVGRVGAGSGANRSSVRNGSIVGIDGTGIRLAQASRVDRVLVASSTNRGVQILGTNGHVTNSSIDSVGAYGIEVSRNAWVSGNAVTQVNLRGVGTFSIWQARGQVNACDDGRCTRFRRFYLTPTGSNGANATFACAAGFHMASLPELFDPSQLSYDTALGMTLDDSGSGPPALAGWVRTGRGASASQSFPGNENCNAWASASRSDYGTLVNWQVDWREGPSSLPMAPWRGAEVNCASSQLVWCIED